MNNMVFLIGYVTTTNEAKAARIVSNTSYGRYDDAAFTSFKNLVLAKTGDQVKYLTGIQRLGDFTPNEISQFEY
ncbi:hypothetical protein ABE427_02460 [Acinetobacter higginsii]|uniref:hypothetical protein n=1 Tax=Acinetobacter higginsii TaxID=70347 RepID=UPI003208E6FB